MAAANASIDQRVLNLVPSEYRRHVEAICQSGPEEIPKVLRWFESASLADAMVNLSRVFPEHACRIANTVLETAKQQFRHNPQYVYCGIRGLFQMAHALERIPRNSFEDELFLNNLPGLAVDFVVICQGVELFGEGANKERARYEEPLVKAIRQFCRKHNLARFIVQDIFTILVERRNDFRVRYRRVNSSKYIDRPLSDFLIRTIAMAVMESRLDPMDIADMLAKKRLFCFGPMKEDKERDYKTIVLVTSTTEERAVARFKEKREDLHGKWVESHHAQYGLRDELVNDGGFCSLPI